MYKKQDVLSKSTFLEGTPGRYIRRDNPPIIPTYVQTKTIFPKPSKKKKKSTATSSSDHKPFSSTFLSSATPFPSIPHKNGPLPPDPNPHLSGPSRSRYSYAAGQDLDHLDYSSSGHSAFPSTSDYLFFASPPGNSSGNSAENREASPSDFEHHCLAAHQKILDNSQLFDPNSNSHLLVDSPLPDEEQDESSLYQSQLEIARCRGLVHTASAPNMMRNSFSGRHSGSTMSVPSAGIQIHSLDVGGEDLTTSTSNQLALNSVSPAPHLESNVDRSPGYQNWIEMYTSDGRRYFIDTLSNTSQWNPPTPPSQYSNNLSPSFSPDMLMNSYSPYGQGVARDYFDYPITPANMDVRGHHYTSLASGMISSPLQGGYRIPRPLSAIYGNQCRFTASTPQLTSQNTQSSNPLRPGININEMPQWLLVYSKAPHETDHLLKWELFRLPQLHFFDDMLMRLYKQEVIDIVVAYERYRLALTTERHRRQEAKAASNTQIHGLPEQQHQQQQHLLHYSSEKGSETETETPNENLESKLDDNVGSEQLNQERTEVSKKGIIVIPLSESEPVENMAGHQSGVGSADRSTVISEHNMGRERADAEENMVRVKVVGAKTHEDEDQEFWNEKF